MSVRKYKGVCYDILFFGYWKFWKGGKKIAEKINDKFCDISRLNKIPEINNEEQIGFVFPIYAWGIPEPFIEFIKKLKNTEAFTFAICTCGADAGIALKKLSRIYQLDSSYSIIMPSNYIIGEEV